MKTFRYTAATLAGARVTGHGFATSELELDRDLESRGMLLTRVKEVGRASRARQKNLSRSELIHFTAQLATVCGAGVPLVEGLRGIARRMPRGVANLVEEMISRLQAGESFSDVLERYPRSFPPVYRASVRAGELSGALDTVLTRMTRHLEWVHAMRATTTQALIYPTILFCAVCGLIAILLYHVLPKIIGLFPGGVDELPGETRAVLAVSDFLTTNGHVLGPLVVAIVGGMVAGQRFPRVRRATHRAILAIPRIGGVAANIATSKFAATASTLQSAGCDVFTVLGVGASTCGNAAMSESFQRAEARVRRGLPISDALAEEPLVDPLLVQMVAVGEKSGRLDQALERLSAHYDEDVPRDVKKMLVLLEPALLVGAGAIVAFVLLAALLPIFEMYDRLG